MKQNLIKFIRLDLKNKWQHFSDEEIDSIISEYIQLNEIHVGNKLVPEIKYAITHEEISSEKIENFLTWGDTNLRDLDFWNKVKYTINSFKSKTGYGILILILHFENQNDAVLFTLCWK